MTAANGPSPTAPAQRIDALDTLRGFALLGILIMNIQSFAMIEAAYFNPLQHMDFSGANRWVWIVSHMFADQKFMAIFSILFGAGIILLTEKGEEAGEPIWGLHAKRNLWLFVFGLIHAYLIWYGDILVTYALCAFLVFLFRRKSPVTLIILGILVSSIAPAFSWLSGWALQQAPPDVIDEVLAAFTATPEQVAAELQAYRGGLWSPMEMRINTAIGLQTEGIPFFLIWRASGLMLIGMALFKLGVLSAERSRGLYVGMIVSGLAIGLPLVALSVVRNEALEWHPIYSMLGLGALYNYVGSLAMATAYIGGIMALVQSGKLSGLQRRLAAVGRMAFTNYILQSVICIFIFYGFGLGLFGYVERWGQILIVFGVWAVQLIVSPLWLSHFRFGPLEWLWRSLTYLQRQPMRRM
ncbi:MAG: DUF418 domain-containing protein [Paracoccaceae bacterium]|nr:DUF418 domain-containing protein [Paracoccaceae bacterium]